MNDSGRLRLYTFAAPSRFYALAGKLVPWFWAAAALLGHACDKAGLSAIARIATPTRLACRKK